MKALSLLCLFSTLLPAQMRTVTLDQFKTEAGGGRVDFVLKSGDVRKGVVRRIRDGQVHLGYWPFRRTPVACADIASVAYEPDKRRVKRARLSTAAFVVAAVGIAALWGVREPTEAMVLTGTLGPGAAAWAVKAGIRRKAEPVQVVCP